METYTRDSDGKKFEFLECDKKMISSTWPNTRIGHLKPIDENPMPDKKPYMFVGDYIVYEMDEEGEREGFYYGEEDHRVMSTIEKHYKRMLHYRNGKLIWEAKR